MQQISNESRLISKQKTEATTCTDSTRFLVQRRAAGFGRRCEEEDEYGSFLWAADGLMLAGLKNWVFWNCV
ncbi:hypothetical protein KY289_017531 [Solanum tuberosum]|nr:hypothetical protein KY284_017298 [Solanum tuberosum]KAH0690173.1 hypothetical protein KY289_017531 [Solanum tuberosum]